MPDDDQSTPEDMRAPALPEQPLNVGDATQMGPTANDNDEEYVYPKYIRDKRTGKIRYPKNGTCFKFKKRY